MIEAVREYFKQFDMESNILEFPVSSATVELAAEAVGCEPARIAKTLSFKVGEDCVLIVMAGDAKIDNSKFKGYFHTKAKMLTPDEVLAYTGHPVGGVCSFAITHPAVKSYCDVSLNRFDIIYPACGSSNSAIPLSPQDLFRYSCNAVEFVDVCKLPEGGPINPHTAL